MKDYFLCVFFHSYHVSKDILRKRGLKDFAVIPSSHRHYCVSKDILRKRGLKGFSPRSFCCSEYAVSKDILRKRGLKVPINHLICNVLGRFKGHTQKTRIESVLVTFLIIFLTPVSKDILRKRGLKDRIFNPVILFIPSFKGHTQKTRIERVLLADNDTKKVRFQRTYSENED